MVDGTFSSKSTANPWKYNLCIDDGGATPLNVALRKCDPTSWNQKFLFDPKTLMVRNPCLDGSGATTQYTLNACDPISATQKFDVLRQQPVNVAMLPKPMQTGDTLLLCASTKPVSLCMSDGGGTTSG